MHLFWRSSLTASRTQGQLPGPSHGRIPAHEGDQALPPSVLAQRPLQLQATPPTHLGKGALDASHRRCSCPHLAEGRRHGRCNGRRAPGEEPPSSGLPLHQQLLSAEREPCGSARGGVRTVNSFFQHRLRSKVQGSRLQGCRLRQSVSPGLPQLRSCPWFPCRGTSGRFESRVKVMEQSLPGLWESHFRRAICRRKSLSDKMSL